MQENVQIGGIVVPIIEEGGEKWYPVSYINKQFFDRPKVSASELKNFVEYYKKQTVDYSFMNNCTNMQEANCINEEGLKLWLKNKHIIRMSIQQKKMYNELCQYLGIEQVETKASICYGFDKVKMYLYDKTEQFILLDYFENNQDNQKLYLCTHCNNYLPYSGQFFAGNSKHGIEAVCLKCKGNKFKMNDYRYKEIYDTFDKDTYELYKKCKVNGNEIQVYEHYINNIDTYYNNKITPEPICNFDSIMKILEYLYSNGDIDLEDLSIARLKEKCKLDFSVEFTTYDVHRHLFGKECMYYIWKYPKLTLDLNTVKFKDTKQIFYNYLEEHNIVIDDVLNFRYGEIFYKCGLSKYTSKYDQLSYIRDLYKGEYGAYEFNFRSNNHWDNLDNRIIAMKHLINKYIGNIDDIPLMLSIRVLKEISSTMYWVNRNHYDGNLYKWINECYPNHFIEDDFDIEKIKGKYDSVEEKQVDFIMRKNLIKPENLIYNDQKFNILDLKPDWIFLTSKKPYVIEYFGLLRLDQLENVVVSDYAERYYHKLETYKKLKNYNVLYIYADDLKDNYRGLIEKVKILNASTH